MIHHDSLKKKNETGEDRWIDSLLRQHSPLRGPIQGHSRNGPVEMNMTYVCIYVSYLSTLHVLSADSITFMKLLCMCNAYKQHA